MAFAEPAGWSARELRLLVALHWLKLWSLASVALFLALSIIFGPRTREYCRATAVGSGASGLPSAWASSSCCSEMPSF